MKPLIISLAVNGREQYELKQQGLINSLFLAGDIDARIIVNHYPIGVTPHSSCPYRFKYDLIQKAVEEGYKKVYWMDSTMRLLKDPFELLEQSEKGIVAFHNLGHPAYKYTTDRAAFNLRFYYDNINDVESTWGGCTGWDFTKPYAYRILTAMQHQASIGSFDEDVSEREGFVAARHDQSALSFILHFYKIPLLEYGIIAAANDVTEKTVIQYG